MAEEQTQEQSDVGITGILGGLGAAVALVPGLRKKAAKGIKGLFRPQTDAVPRSTNQVPVAAERSQILVPKDKQDLAVTQQLAKDDAELLKIKNAVMSEPLSFGGKSKGPYNFGSTTYDFIALHPAKKALKADQWIAEFTNPARLADLRYSTPGFQNIRANVTRQELEDLNLAKFDGNKLTGGFLKAAKDANVRIDKLTLLRLAEQSPLGSLKITFKGRPKYYRNLADEISQDRMSYIANKVAFLRPKLKALGLNKRQIDTFDDQTKVNLIELQKSNNYSYKVNTAGTQEGFLDPLRTKEEMQRGLRALDQLINEQGTTKLIKASKTYDQTTGADKLESLNQKIDQYVRHVSQSKTENLSTKYGSQRAYRLQGAEAYDEFIVQITPPSRLGRAPRNVAHFAQEGEDQLYFVRYGTRSEYYNPDSKIYAIDEIQADLMKGFEDAVKSGQKLEKPINPYNVEFLDDLTNLRSRELVSDAREILDKGVMATQQERTKLQELNNQLKTLLQTNQTTTAKNVLKEIKKQPYPYRPVSSKEDYADHAVKVLAKRAALNDVDFIAVNPSNIQHDILQGKKAGNQKFYGMTEGKDVDTQEVIRELERKVERGATLDPTQVKLLASLKKARPPKGRVVEAMERLAKQYNSRVEKIMVSKSDPKKPFKVVTTVGRENTALHLGAFRTRDEAQSYANYIGEGLVKEIKADDPKNYYEAFGLYISNEMKTQPFKIYRKIGGLVVDLFK
jgi:hypothetical protein